MLPRHAAVTTLVTLFLLSSALALSVGAQDAGEDDAPRLSVVVTDVAAAFEPEAWKYNPEYLRGAFQSPEDFEQRITNESSSYFSAMGYRVRLTVQVIEEGNGNPVSDSNVNLTAAATAWDGSTVEPFILRDGSDGSIFHLDFDVDGASAAGPDGKPMQWLSAGFQSVDVEIFEDTLASQPITRGETTVSFVYDLPRVNVGIDLPRDPQKRLPESLVRLFNNLGWSDHAEAIDQPVPTGANVTLGFNFAFAADREATLKAHIAYRGEPTTGTESPAGGTVSVPHVPGVTDRPDVQNVIGATDSLVIVEEQTLATERVDSTGSVSFSVSPSSVTDASALVLFSVELENATVPTGEPRGGSGVVVGAHSVLLPVVGSQQAQNPLDVISFGLQGPGLVSQEEARQLNQLAVRVRDPVGQEQDAGRSGDLYAVHDDEFQSELLSKGSIRQDSDPERQRDRVGSLSTSHIQEEKVNRYRVYAFLYDSSDQFYSLTYADRGFVLQTASPMATTDEHATLYLNVTSWTTNYDDNPSETEFQITVRVAAFNEQLNVDRNQTITVGEAGFQSVPIEVSPASPGTYEVTVEAFSADTTTGELIERVRFVRPEGEQGFVDRIPGFELPVLLAGATLALAWVAFRRRDR